jgi:sugar/nucleoside kinase (ribokinase family)
MNKKIDILGLGYTAVDDLLYVDGYPTADAKTEVRRRERQCGGLAATALVAAARMGCRCAYAGILGDDDPSRFVVARFHEEGIDTSHVGRRDGAGPVRSTIVVEQCHRTRTILFDLSGVVGIDLNWPPEEVIRAAKVLLVDHCGVEGMIRAAQIAHESRSPVVADLESSCDPLFPKLLALADHLILSRGFALKLTGHDDPEAAARALWTPERRAVVITCGGDRSWFLSDAHSRIARHEPALPVEVVDTTGCGDVFHGAYAAALIHDLDVAAAVRFASAAAALKATARGGQAGIPTRAAVVEQLNNGLCDHVQHGVVVRQ